MAAPLHGRRRHVLSKLVVVVSSFASAAELQLTGVSSSILMGSTRLSATCGSDGAAAVQLTPTSVACLENRSECGFDGTYGAGVRVLISKLPPTCTNSLPAEPCASTDWPALFSCSWVIDGQEVLTGPTHALREVDWQESVVMGVKTIVVCPMPTLLNINEILNTLTPASRST